MADQKRPDCPPECSVNHRRGRALNKTCSGEMLWHNDSAAVELAPYGDNNFIVLATFSDNVEPVGANLTLDEAQELRDALDSVLRRRRAA